MSILKIDITIVPDFLLKLKFVSNTFWTKNSESSHSASFKKYKFKSLNFQPLIAHPVFSTPLVMQCCPCSGPTTTISALFTDAPNSIDISEINTIDYEDVTDQTTFLSDDDNLITTTEFEGLYMKLL